jgi:SAM-dependent methyltransferase
MNPIDVLTGHTMQFVRRSLPRSPARLLEIGAGSGHLARALADEGHEVVAIDASAKAVERAAGLGHNVRHVDWHDFDESGFDAIIFSRSLHHIDRLDDGADRCWPRLEPGGRVILEEFSAADVDVPTAHWMRDQLETLVETGAVETPDRSFLVELLASDDPHAWWHEHHGHLHADADMRSALQRRGRIIAAEQAPYLYRYFLVVADVAAGDKP